MKLLRLSASLLVATVLGQTADGMAALAWGPGNDEDDQGEDQEGDGP